MSFPRMYKPAAALLLALGLAGCAATESCLDGQPRRSPAPDAAGLVKDRYLDDATLFLGAPYEIDCGAVASTSRLKSVRDKATGALRHQLVVKRNFEATGWHYYGRAVAEPDETLRLSVVDRQVGKCQRISWMGCDHSEEVALDLPEPLLAAAAEKARRIHISNRGGEKGFALWLTPEQVREHLDLIRVTPR